MNASPSVFANMVCLVQLRRLRAQAGILLALVPLAAGAAISTDINTAGPTDDVVISGTPQTLSSTKTINSLEITGIGGQQGLTLSTNVLTLTSGNIDLKSDLAAISSGSGSSTGGLNFGTATANIHGQSRNFLGSTGTLILSGSGGINYSGDITLIGVNAQYTGATTIKASSSLTLGNFNATNKIADTSALVVESGATLKADGRLNASETFGSLAGAGTINISPNVGNTVTLIMGGDNTSTTFSGALNGRFNLTKNGTGVFTFSGTSTNTGTNTVNAGTMIVNGSLAASTTVVANGGTLSGNGTLGATTIQSGGGLNPGESAGKLTFTGPLTLAGSTVMEISGTARGVAGGYDAIDVGTDQLLTYGGTLTLSLTGLVANSTYELFDFSAGFAAGNFTSVAFSGGFYTGSFTQAGAVWTASSQGQIFTLDTELGSLNVIPEPQVALLLGLSVLVFLGRRKN